MFPRKEQEEALLAQYAAEDAPGAPAPGDETPQPPAGTDPATIPDGKLLA
jgi:hypothetical protein